MKLKNPFPMEVRELWEDAWECMECGENGQRSGGLELHHIVGRSSSSALNSCLLCKGCHSKIGHSKEEEQRLFARSFKYLALKNYKVTKKDYQFITEQNHLWRENNSFLMDLLKE